MQLDLVSWDFNLVFPRFLQACQAGLFIWSVVLLMLQGNYDPTGSKFAEGKEKMLKIALNACANLAKEISEKSTQ